MDMKALIFLPFVLLLVLAGCSSQGGCYVLDKRFSCEGGVDDSGPYIVFTKVPPGKFTLQRTLLMEKDVEGGSEECLPKDGNTVEQGQKRYFQCPEKTGDLELSIKIMHAEQASYQPTGGETCLKQNNKWQCDTRARLSFVQ